MQQARVREHLFRKKYPVNRRDDIQLTPYRFGPSFYDNRQNSFHTGSQ